MTADQFEAKRKAEKEESRQRMRLNIAAKLLAAAFDFDAAGAREEPFGEQTRDAVRSALQLADMLIEEAGR